MTMSLFKHVIAAIVAAVIVSVAAVGDTAAQAP